MKRFYVMLLLLFGLIIKVNAQKAEFGQIDITDLQMTSCDFEKSANAMVLFDVANIKYDNKSAIVMAHHRRIKIFNYKGFELANVRIEYNNRFESIKNIEAETINLNDGKIEKIALDKKFIYTQKIDKQKNAIVFTLPGIKAGSVIEFKYTKHTSLPFPGWLFQNLVPTCYSELTANFVYGNYFNIVKKLSQPLIIDTIYKTKYVTTHKWALHNVSAFRLELYMNSIEDNLQGIYFRSTNWYNNWPSISRRMLQDKDFGGQLNQILNDETTLINDAKELKTNDEKIDFLFNTVKNTIKWNNIDQWYTDDGVKNAWLKKTGNSAEINIILYHLLKSAGVKTSLLALGTRYSGEIEADNPSFGRINKIVVKAPIDSLNFYVLDASSKYNSYYDTPFDLLGINMLPIEEGKLSSDLVKIRTIIPSKEFVFINADIKPTGKLEGSVQLSSSNYKRISKLVAYDKLGEKKYIDEELKRENNTLELNGFKMMNMEVDTLPLREDFNFKLELTGSDETYIYFSPNLFTGLGPNPFLSESRLSDIDFIFPNIYSINGRYKIPVGYKIDVLPKTLNITMPDNSIVFKRIVGEMQGAVVVHYVIDFRNTKYSRDEYPKLREFYKKMYEMLNEQIVLKKG